MFVKSESKSLISTFCCEDEEHVEDVDEAEDEEVDEDGEGNEDVEDAEEVDESISFSLPLYLVFAMLVFGMV